MPLSCGRPEVSEPSDSDLALIEAELPLVQVHLSRPSVWPGVRQPDELAGLYLALVESGLVELPGVTAVVDGVDPSPGVASAVSTGGEHWRALLALVPDGEGVRYGLLLCDPQNNCLNHESYGDRQRPWSATAELLAEVADALGRPATPAVMDGWARPQSADGYAVLVAGRSAAVFYGIRPPVSPEDYGDNRRDPVERAVFLDPSMPIAWWTHGRRDWINGDARAAREAFTRARIARPESVLWQADEAAALGMQGRWEESWAAWEPIQERSPDDPRFAVARASSALKAEKVQQALAILDALPPAAQTETAVAEMRVAIAEVTGQSSNYDELLARWQEAAPADPEPVRRRIAVRIDEGRWAEGLELTDELSRRGAQVESHQLAMSLALGSGELDRAGQEAAALHSTVLEDKIRFRTIAEGDPSALTAEFDPSADPYASLVYAEARLASGDATGALQMATAVLQDRQWCPEAWDVVARAQRAQGKEGEAVAAERQRDWADPDFARRSPPILTADAKE